MHRTTLDTSRYRKLSPGPGSPASQVAVDQRTRIQSAMIELVGEEGYEAVSLRRLATLAGVSTKTFYEHFESKAECFLRTYELVVERISARVVSAQADETDWPQRVELALQGLAAELVNKPRAARLALLEVFEAGPAALETLARVEAHSEAMLTQSFARPSGQVKISPNLARAIVSGVSFVARTRMIGATPVIGTKVAGELSQWVLSLQNRMAGDRVSVPAVGTRPSPPKAEPSEREIILTATAKLAAASGYWQLTVPRILTAAGLRKKNFAAHFTGVEDCFLAVLDQRTASLIDRAMTASTGGQTWSNRVGHSIENLCATIAADPVTARLVFVESRSAGRAAVDRQDAILTGWAGELVRNASSNEPTSSIHAEASLGAIWGVVRGYIDVSDERLSGRSTDQRTLEN